MSLQTHLIQRKGVSTSIKFLLSILLAILILLTAYGVLYALTERSKKAIVSTSATKLAEKINLACATSNPQPKSEIDLPENYGICFGGEWYNLPPISPWYFETDELKNEARDSCKKTECLYLLFIFEGVHEIFGFIPLDRSCRDKNLAIQIDKTTGCIECHNGDCCLISRQSFFRHPCIGDVMADGCEFEFRISSDNRISVEFSACDAYY